MILAGPIALRQKTSSVAEVTPKLQVGIAEIQDIVSTGASAAVSLVQVADRGQSLDALSPTLEALGSGRLLGAWHWRHGVLGSGGKAKVEAPRNSRATRILRALKKAPGPSEDHEHPSRRGPATPGLVRDGGLRPQPLRPPQLKPGVGRVLEPSRADVLHDRRTRRGSDSAAV